MAPMQAPLECVGRSARFSSASECSRYTYVLPMPALQRSTSRTRGKRPRTGRAGQSLHCSSDNDGRSPLTSRALRRQAPRCGARTPRADARRCPSWRSLSSARLVQCRSMHLVQGVPGRPSSQCCGRRKRRRSGDAWASIPDTRTDPHGGTTCPRRRPALANQYVDSVIDPRARLFPCPAAHSPVMMNCWRPRPPSMRSVDSHHDQSVPRCTPRSAPKLGPPRPAAAREYTTSSRSLPRAIIWCALRPVSANRRATVMYADARSWREPRQARVHILPRRSYTQTARSRRGPPPAAR
ncbi:hypothetical protein B0H17DRAFT_1339989, partial [Mycena rosella]